MKPVHETTRLLVLLLLGLLVIPVQAANFRFLKDSVLTRFSEQDASEFKAFVGDALNTAKDKDVLLWKSSSSRLMGKLKLDFSYNSGSTPCRRSLFLITDQQRPSERFQFEICKSGEHWQIQDTAARSMSESDWQLLRETGELALNYDGYGTPFSWHNAATGLAGVITPLPIEKLHGKTCRELAITVFDKAQLATNGVYLMCKTDDGDWQRNIQDYRAER